MKAIRFPKMLDNNKATVVKDMEATEQNIKTLLLSAKQTLMGDPYFGVNLQRLVFEPNNIIIQDLVTDEILEALHTYIPQLQVDRKNITLKQDGDTVTVQIYAQNILDYSFDEYTIKLLEVEEL